MCDDIGVLKKGVHIRLRDTQTYNFLVLIFILGIVMGKNI